MEIIRGSLDDISRPASSEQTGSRVSSVSFNPTLYIIFVHLSGQCHIEVTDDEKEDSKLQRAIEEMRRLDEILSAKICIEKEVKRQRKELKAKLWQELQVFKVFIHSTLHYHFTTRFWTKKRWPLLSHMVGEEDKVFMTQAEKERLADLLREVDEEDGEDMWAVSVLTGQGYSPEPSDLEQLIDIDSKICLLLPAEELLSVQSSFTNLSLGPGLWPTPRRQMACSSFA
uniref:Fibrous sheath-interacting protein 1 n=1 Tax=Sander lucioperca TaxID=283035 RepID=A0A8C9Z9D5_SANLU